MKYLSAAWKEDKLWGGVLISWYLTVFSSFFESYLFRIALPIGGYFFLFRGVLPLTVILFAVWCIRRKKNPFAELTTFEKAFLLLVVVMLLYGAGSFFFAISRSAWLSKYLIIGSYLIFALLFVLLGKDSSVRWTTLLLACGTMLICTIGGLIEVYHGCFFDVPAADYRSYYFMRQWLQIPIFTFYNTNGFCTSNFWMLLIAWMLLFEGWADLSQQRQRIALWFLTALTCLSVFLYAVSKGRLTIFSLPFLFVGIAVWLLIRYKRGLWIFAAFTCFFLFIYVGENYDQITAYATYAKEYIQAIKVAPPAEPETPAESETPAEPVLPVKPEPPVIEPNRHSTMSTLVPVDSETGQVSISSDESGRIRLHLLQSSMEVLLASKGLGVGVGNGGIRIGIHDGSNGAPDIHCFIMEVFLEFGFFAMVPLLLLLSILLKSWFLRIRHARREGDLNLLSNTLFQIFAVMTYPFLSTANASSWGVAAMWLFLGYILLENSEKEKTLRISLQQ